MEEALERLFQSSGLITRDREALEPQVKNFANARTKALYTALSKDRVEQQAFWHVYKAPRCDRPCWGVCDEGRGGCVSPVAAELINHVIRATTT